MRYLVNIIAAFCLSACAVAQPSHDTEQMYIKASALTKLSTAVHGFIRYENPPENLTDSEVLQQATREDPALLSPFSGYKLRVLRQNRNASVLMCSADSTQGLLEDVGCTAQLDKHLWLSGKHEVCEFTLNIEVVCGQD